MVLGTHHFYLIHGWVTNAHYIRGGGLYQGTFTEGDSSVRLTSLYYLVCISSFYIGNTIYLCYKTSYVSEEVNCTKLFLSVGGPWLGMASYDCLACQRKLESNYEL